MKKFEKSIILFIKSIFSPRNVKKLEPCVKTEEGTTDRKDFCEMQSFIDEDEWKKL